MLKFLILALVAVLTACASDGPTPAGEGVATVAPTGVDSTGGGPKPAVSLPKFEVPATMPELIGIIKAESGGHSQARMVQCSLLPGGLIEVVPEETALTPHASLDVKHKLVRYTRRSGYSRATKALQTECPRNFLVLMTRQLVVGLRALDSELRNHYPELFELTRNLTDKDINSEKCFPKIQTVRLDIRLQSDKPDGKGGVQRVVVDPGYQVAGIYGDLPLSEESREAGQTQFLPFVYGFSNGFLLDKGTAGKSCKKFF